MRRSGIEGEMRKWLVACIESIRIRENSEAFLAGVPNSHESGYTETSRFRTSWPQAAEISVPSEYRVVTLSPACFKASEN